MADSNCETASRMGVVKTANRMVQLGLNRGLSGNVSLRFASGFLITPSGIPPHSMKTTDIVFMDMDGKAYGKLIPSSEWRFHLDILRTKQHVCAIVHAHPPFSVALASHRRSIPAYHYMVAKGGGDNIRCADYATYGTKELSDNIVKALDDRHACLIANHGMVATGSSLESALLLAIELEELAEGYWRTLQLGDPVILDKAEMAIIIEKFSGYGNRVK